MVDFAAWTPADWSAMAAWLTVLIALTAAYFAFRQVGEARRLREAQAQPYVVAFMEPSPFEPQIVNVVVKNFGSTVARNVRLHADPPLQRSSGMGEIEDVWLFDLLPTLVPGQSWQTIWDFGPERAQTQLPKRHTVVVSAEDYRGRRLDDEKFVLDWSAFEQRQWVTEYGVHHAAKALREINQKMGRWQERGRGGLSVVVRDGDKKDESQRRQFSATRARAEAAARPEIPIEDVPPGSE